LVRTATRGRPTRLTKTGRFVATHVEEKTYKLLNELAIFEDRSVAALLRIAIENFVRTRVKETLNSK